MMVDHTQTTAVEPIDVKEVASAMDMAAGLFAFANTSFADLAALFEAIGESADRGSLTRRLASLGRNMCDTLENDFGTYQDDYQARAECYSVAHINDASLRITGAEDSSKDGA